MSLIKSDFDMDAMKSKENISALIAGIANPDNVKEGVNRQIVYSASINAACFILHAGVVSLYRKADHLLIGNLTAPDLIGINFSAKKQKDIYIQARSDIRFELVTPEVLQRAVQDKNLWAPLALHFMYVSDKLAESHFETMGASSWQLIRHNLLKLMDEERVIREAITACDYIVEKTLLSRSNVMAVLSQLRKGNYIELTKGKLTRIIKLPSNY